ncbi:ATP:cob(I)alamin adenosyltransferase [Candidatus Roizmanbacteria bacterium CG09_land_8_20_14_0_10_41_9]|uniref:Corrinoid adenosyltransferase n=1 Tax=Candidatus Roizmanbacteria bacterium CG09_land_8_20_14_0_10_41_9 TaxID=1974850 RepID=A0A2H0WU00_9BACT|nr:MAG: ATP:cob(I)alamin adenosyltransferase [Candidatus Roizmanbacteria bacterium CG09_land_8_20_14_0_10_41_9]
MSIYTKTGDAGTTSLFNGNRVPKSDIRIKACGELDELSSHIGYALPLTQDVKIRGLLLKVQKNLSRTMSIISGAKLDTKEMQKQVKLFETIIDKESSTLTKLDKFILPSGSAISAWFHILRAVCRRAERAVVECKTMKQPAFVPLSGTTAGKLSNETIDPIISYLNRLSDLFFILARVYNTDKEIFA